MEGVGMRFFSWLLLLCFFGTPLISAQNVHYSYDELGRIVGVVDQNGNAAQYTYDANGNTLSISRYTSSQVAVLSFSPASGSAGTTVTISGANFGAGAAQDIVSFNGVAASILSATVNQIIATVPSGATTGPVSVTAPLGSSMSSRSFTVLAGNVAPPSISSVTPNIALPGDSVKLSGSNFGVPSSNDLVSINNKSAVVADLASVDSLSFIVPTGVGSGPVKLLTPYGSVTSSTDLYIPPSPYTVSQVAVAQRVSLGISTVVTIPTSGNIGMLVFNGAVGQLINLQITNSTFTACLNYSILKPDGSQLTTGKTCGTTGTLQGISLPLAGTYTALIFPSSGGTGSATVTLSTDQVGSLTMDNSDPLALNIPGQNARLSFSGIPGQLINLGFTNSTVCFDYSILNPDGSRLIGSRTCNAGVALQEVSLPSTGTYTALISPLNGGTGSTTVTLSTDQVSPLAMDSSDQLTFSPPGQDARLSFSGTAGQLINLAVSKATVCLNYSILNTDGSQLTSGVTCFATGALEAVSLPSTGTYTALISPLNGATGSTTVTLSTDQVGSLSMNSSDPLTFSLPGQNARLSFSGTAGQLINLQITNSTIAPCLNYSILNPDGSQLATALTCGATGALNPVSLPSTGTYTALISPINGGTGSAMVALSTDQAPTFTSMSPSTASNGDSPFQLTVTGSHFLNGSIVQWNGSNRPTTFVSATQLIASIPASDVLLAGTAQVTVSNPYGTSSALIFTINQAPVPNLTQTGTIIAKITAPTGGGNHNPEVIRDGDMPPIGNTDSSRQYDTYSGGAPSTDDWIGYQYSSTQTFAKVVFQEGKNFVNGGWFNNLNVQVRQSGAWVNVSNLISTPAYPPNDGINYETYTLDFSSISGDAIRIDGVPGGTSYFISVGELQVYGP